MIKIIKVCPKPKYCYKYTSSADYTRNIFDVKTGKNDVKDSVFFIIIIIIT